MVSGGKGMGGGGGMYIRARRTSGMGMTPSFSPAIGSEKRLKASRMSVSSWAVMPCSLASLEGRAVREGPASVVAAAGRRLGG